MSDWATELPAVIRAAVKAGGGEVVVRTEAMAALGESALERMAPGAEGITFCVDPSKVTIATVPGHLAGPFEVRDVIGPATPEFSPDWEGDRAQAAEVAGAELGLMISQWHYRKRPEMTTAELAHVLAREVHALLRYVIRAERAGQAEEDEEDDDD
jgi:hypothetical protein